MSMATSALVNRSPVFHPKLTIYAFVLRANYSTRDADCKRFQGVGMAYSGFGRVRSHMGGSHYRQWFSGFIWLHNTHIAGFIVFPVQSTLCVAEYL